MAVDADTVGLEDLNFNTLITFGAYDNFGSRIGNVYRHDK